MQKKIWLLRLVVAGSAVGGELGLGPGVLRRSRWRQARGHQNQHRTLHHYYPRFLFLAGNLTYSSTNGNAITINADDVTLDLMGNSLSGPGAATGTVEGIIM